MHACAVKVGERGIRRLIVQTFHGKTGLPDSSDYTTGRTSFRPAKTDTQPTKTKSKAKGTADRIDPSITRDLLELVLESEREREREREKGPLNLVCVMARGHENRGLHRD